MKSRLTTLTWGGEYLWVKVRVMPLPLYHLSMLIWFMPGVLPWGWMLVVWGELGGKLCVFPFFLGVAMPGAVLVDFVQYVLEGRRGGVLE